MKIKTIMIIVVLAVLTVLAGCGNGMQKDNANSSNVPAGSSDEQSTKNEGYDVEIDFDADNYYARLEHCVEQIREKTDFVPDIALVLGSGMGDYIDSVKVIAEIPYSEIEGFPASTVSGHDGTLVFCEIEGKKVAIMNGRVHFYEGYDVQDVVLPLRVIHMLGANTVILTNAVGAINEDYNVGDFVVNLDHISSFVPSPLIGENIDEFGERFIDMTNAYDEEMISIVEDVAAENNIPIHRGVMIQVTGPQYETPTEIKMFRSFGADTVGMSTVVEVIAARHMGMRACVISNVTNMAAGLQEEISHEEVQNSADSTIKNAEVLIDGLLSRLSVPEGDAYQE